MPRRKSEPQVRLHIVIPRSQYEQLLAVTGASADKFHGHAYGRISYVLRLALGHYLTAIAPSNPPTFQEEALNELAKL